MTSSRRAGYEELDAKRESYENELEWLEQQDKENIEAGRAIQVRLRLVSLSCFLRHADAVSGDRSGMLLSAAQVEGGLPAGAGESGGAHSQAHWRAAEGATSTRSKCVACCTR